MGELSSALQRRAALARLCLLPGQVLGCAQRSGGAPCAAFARARRRCPAGAAPMRAPPCRSPPARPNPTGLNRTAHFLALDTFDHGGTLLRASVFYWIYWSFAAPR